MRQLGLITAMVLWLAVRAAAQGQASSIQGIVVDDRSGRGLAGAKVYAVRVAPRALTTGTVQSRADGAFDLAPLAGGKYQICVFGIPGYASNCLWIDGSNAVMVDSGRSVSGVVVRLKTGVRLTARVNDPGGLLKIPVAGRKPRLEVLLGDGRGNFLPMDEKGDGNGATYGAFVPLDVVMTLRVSTSGVVVNDEGGRALAAGHADIGFTHTTADQSAGRSERVMTYTVAGSGR